MTTNHSTSYRINEFIDQIRELTGWTLTASVVDRGVLFDCDEGTIFYEWAAIAEDQMDAESVANMIMAASKK